MEAIPYNVAILMISLLPLHQPNRRPRYMNITFPHRSHSQPRLLFSMLTSTNKLSSLVMRLPGVVSFVDEVPAQSLEVSSPVVPNVEQPVVLGDVVCLA
jgi:hypothetical protein